MKERSTKWSIPPSLGSQCAGLLASPASMRACAQVVRRSTPGFRHRFVLGLSVCLADDRTLRVGGLVPGGRISYGEAAGTPDSPVDGGASDLAQLAALAAADSERPVLPSSRCPNGLRFDIHPVRVDTVCLMRQKRHKHVVTLLIILAGLTGSAMIMTIPSLFNPQHVQVWITVALGCAFLILAVVATHMRRTHLSGSP